MFHIDSGSLHHIENIGTEPAEFIIVFSHERPEDFGLGAAFGAMTDAVLGNTYDLDAADFAKLRRDTVDRKLAGRVGAPWSRRMQATATPTSSRSTPLPRLSRSPAQRR
jgi:oxalate decarboxylase